ncbi:MAG: SIMPL domain-containing protein [Firmicutes bacterium]|nr:SIMPL domain-containing protein [Bacillota bacterium]
MKMRFRVFVACCLSAIFMLTATAFAAETNGKRTITTNGNGSVFVEPDTAKVNIGVQTTEQSASEAQSKNAEIMKNVIESLGQIGITKEQIKTSDFFVYPSYSYNENSEGEIKNYTASNTIEVTTNDLDSVSSIIDTATQAGANNNNGVHFSVKDPSKYYGEALALAVNNAKTSADYIAKTIGFSIGAPISISEESNGYSYEKGFYKETAAYDVAENSSGRGSTEIYYDDIEISARVKAVYEY